MGRFDHPVYRNHPSARARTARTPATEGRRRPGEFAGRRVGAPSDVSILIACALVALGVLLTTGLLP